MCVGYIKSIIHAVASDEIKSPHKKKKERKEKKKVINKRWYRKEKRPMIK